MEPTNGTNKKNEGDTVSNINNVFNLEYVLESIFDQFSKGLRIIGPIFAFALTIFVLIVTHAFFQIILPYWIKTLGILCGIILTLIAIFLLVSILFNYFLSVLVKPGNIEDVRKSKFYKKNNPLTVSNSIVNLNVVFSNSLNNRKFVSDTNSKVEVKMRLKAADNLEVRDDISKEDHLLINANIIKTEVKEPEYSCNKVQDNDLSIDFMTDENFRQHIESKLQCLPSENSNAQKDFTDDFEKNLIENKYQLEEINSYYADGLNKSNGENKTEGHSSTDNENSFSLSDCRYCKIPKPIRAHHCTICGYCVLKMDHHCPWINNCVGQNNHRYFVLFLTHLMFGCLYVCLTSIPIIFNSKITKSMEFNFVTVLAFVGFLLMVFFNSWNWFLVIRGNTTIEFWSLKANFYSNMPIRDFSLNNWRENIFLVFGTRSLFKAIFIPSIKRLPYSGLEWTKMCVPSFYYDEFNPQEEELKISPLNSYV